MIFLDTESVGKTGPLVLIQWALDSNDAIIYKVWNNSIIHTLTLIESFCNTEVCGFNLTHDWFMLTKWYNVFRQVKNKEALPNEQEIKEIETRGPMDKDVVLKPRAACDLMLLARSGKFQYLSKHKPIIIRKIPTIAVESVISALSQMELPTGVRVRWRVTEKRGNTRQDVKDIVGEFLNLSTSLKNLSSIVLGKPEIAEGTFESEVGRIPYRETPYYRPWGGDWSTGLRILRRTFETERALSYARNDIVYTHALWENLGRPPGGDDDSELACLVGASYWKGFAINKEAMEKKLPEYIKDSHAIDPSNPNSPQSVLEYLHSYLNPTERLIVQDTKKTTLEEIERWENHGAEAVKRVRRARKAHKRITMMKRLLRSGRFCFSMKIVGTLSSRMAGGFEEKSDGGKINPQGIPRETEFRSLFPLAFPGEGLEGGDFDAFEPSILDAIIGDEQFHKDLTSGLKIHLFAGSEFYKIPPQDILKTKGTREDKYIRSKNGFLGWIYGALQRKIAQTLDLTEPEVEEGFQRINNRYPSIRYHRQKLQGRFTPLIQIGDIGSAIEWRTPDNYIESILGFKRYFSLEWSVVYGLYQLATTPPEEWDHFRGDIRRTNRVQTIKGAIQSALYAAIFGLQAHVFRAAANHEIQSPGAQITKHLQRRIWDLQPCGVGPWIVRPLNIHDEVLVPCVKDVSDIVSKVVMEMKQKVPLLSMTWKKLKNWGEK